MFRLEIMKTFIALESDIGRIFFSLDYVASISPYRICQIQLFEYKQMRNFANQNFVRCFGEKSRCVHSDQTLGEFIYVNRGNEVISPFYRS
jgi:hypothetical protein